MYFSTNNQRSFQRMDLNIPVSITKAENVYEGICLDLSSTGMGISFSTTDLHADDLVSIQLETSDERFPPLNAESKLIRVIEAEDGTFTAAVEFITLK